MISYNAQKGCVPLQTFFHASNDTIINSPAGQDLDVDVSETNDLQLSEQLRNQAYREIGMGQVIEGRREQVFQAISQSFGGLTNWEIAERLHLPINCITGRVNELYKAGKLMQSGVRLNRKTGKNNTVWTIK